MKEKFQQFGKSMLVPISLIALTGLLLGLGGALTTQLTMTSFGIDWDWYTGTAIYQFFLVIKGLGQVVIGNLGVLYAIGIAFSLARKEKGWSAFSAIVCYLGAQNTVQTLLNGKGLTAANTTRDFLIKNGMAAADAAKASSLYTTSLGFFTYNTGVFGGILIGLLVAYLHNKFYKTKLPVALSFFSGTRTVPIISLVSSGFIGLFFYLVWPTIGGLFANVSQFVHNAGLIGTGLYRFAYESLVPFGMHSLLGVPMQWTEIGGTMMVDGKLVAGVSAIQLAQLASPESGKLLVRAFMAGQGVKGYAIYPGIALALYKTAKPENKKKVAGLLIPAIISCVLFGITEPILFTFLFIAPALYFLLYAPLAGLGEAISEAAGVSVYQGNIKDLIPFLLRPEKLNLWPYLWILPLFFIVSYLLFKFFILKFNLQTPGREENVSTDDIHLISKAEYKEKTSENKDKSLRLKKSFEDKELAKKIVEALGGEDNIEDVDNCISRLRIVLKDPSLMKPDEIFTKELNALGVMHVGNGVQIVYGPAVTNVALDVKDILNI